MQGLPLNLGNDLYGCGPTPVMLTTDKHATKVAIYRGTPKSKFESASHGTVGLILISSLKKCGKQKKQKAGKLPAFILFLNKADSETSSRSHEHLKGIR